MAHAMAEPECLTFGAASKSSVEMIQELLTKFSQPSTQQDAPSAERRSHAAQRPPPAGVWSVDCQRQAPCAQQVSGQCQPRPQQRLEQPQPQRSFEPEHVLQRQRPKPKEDSHFHQLLLNKLAKQVRAQQESQQSLQPPLTPQMPQMQQTPQMPQMQQMQQRPQAPYAPAAGYQPQTRVPSQDWHKACVHNRSYDTASTMASIDDGFFEQTPQTSDSLPAWRVQGRTQAPAGPEAACSSQRRVEALPAWTSRCSATGPPGLCAPGRSPFAAHTFDALPGCFGAPGLNDANSNGSLSPARTVDSLPAVCGYPAARSSDGHLARGYVTTYDSLPALQETDGDLVARDTGAFTTLMIRNIPPMYTEDMLIEEWAGSNFDFLYLPRGSRGKANVGYAFLNLATPQDALAFKVRWNKVGLAMSSSRKILNVSFAEVQGLRANLVQLAKKLRTRSLEARGCHPVIIQHGVCISMEEALHEFSELGDI